MKHTPREAIAEAINRYYGNPATDPELLDSLAADLGTADTLCNDKKILKAMFQTALRRN